MDPRRAGLNTFAGRTSSITNIDSGLYGGSERRPEGRRQGACAGLVRGAHARRPPTSRGGGALSSPLPPSEQ